MKGLGSIVSWAILIAGAAGIIYPAFIEGPHGAPPPSFTQAIVALFLEPRWDLGFFMRILCVVVVVCAGYVVVITRMYHNLPITVVKTSIQVNVSKDFSKAAMSRVQLLRANQSNVSAYFTAVTPNATSGMVPEDGITMEAYCHGQTINSTFDLNGSEQSGFEVIHDFGCHIPYRWFMPLFPASIYKGDVDGLVGFIRNNIVTRRQSAVYIDEFNTLKPRMDFVARNYPGHNISVTINFEDRIPPSFYTKHIKNSGVVNGGFEKIDEKSIRVRADILDSETIRFGWYNGSANT
jgi:hypothetical protein